MNASTTLSPERPVTLGKDATRKILLDNDRVTVIETSYPPGSGVPMHEHRFPHAGYVIEGGQVEITAADGKSTRLNLATGQAVWREPQSHSARNVGSTPLRVVEVEVKGAAGG